MPALIPLSGRVVCKGSTDDSDLDLSCPSDDHPPPMLSRQTVLPFELSSVDRACNKIDRREKFRIRT
jgi:hypothetical protein